MIASDAAAGDLFGSAIAVSGNYAIVGAPFDDDNGTTSGSAYLFEISTGREVTKFLHGTSNETSNETSARYGSAAAASKQTILIGAFADAIEGVRRGRLSL